MKDRNLLLVVIAIALVGLACSNSKKSSSGDGKDAGNASGQVDGGGGSDREAGQGADAELDSGDQLDREAGARADGQVAETDGAANREADTAGPTISSDGAVDATPASQADGALGLDAAVDGLLGGGDADAGSDPAVPCPNGCSIGGVCYPAGVSNPANPCLVCDRRRSFSAWSSNDGATCDDGQFCTVADRCEEGNCQGVARSCSDGVACNGVETCDEATDTCVAGTSTCGGNRVCEQKSGRCVATCTGCVIGGTCYGEGQSNPANPCQRCARASNASAWSHNDGALCDDGAFCTVGDTCSAGTCAGSARNCSDSIACNGVETCDETTDACVAGIGTCGGDSVCILSTGACMPLSTCPGCVIENVCYGNGQANPANPCLKCDRATSLSAWSDNDGALCSDDLFCTVGDTCAAGVCAGSTRDCSDDITCNGDESCNETNDKCDHGESTCTGDQACDLETNQCVATCTGCVIEGVCYGNGQPNPGNQCQKCDKIADADGWTNNQGAACNDGKFCTVGETCNDSGVCAGGATRDCSDGVACNGVETCNLVQDKCVPAVSTCPAGTSCDVEDDECVATCAGCLIGGTCYGPGQTNPDNPCEKCPDNSSATAWSNRDDGDSCDDGSFCNGVDTCTSGSCVHGGSPCSGGTSCVESKKACFMVGVPLCNADGDVIRYNASGESTLLDDCVAASAHGTCVAGVCGCAEGYTGADCHAEDQPPSCLVHVRPVGNDASNGSTWALAVANVQKGLDLAAAKIGGEVTACEVWVASGLYKPTTGTDRTVSITLKDKVGLYGGFLGNEVRRSQRDIAANPTVLSGDIGTPGDNADNSYHVVIGASGATIDGFTITGGNANAASFPDHGGGGMINSSSPTVTRCTFSNNSATYGGGMYNASSASPTVTNCTFSYNNATSLGGAMLNDFSSPAVTNCTFSNNSAGASGGGMGNSSSSPTVTSSIFWQNTAPTDSEFSGGGETVTYSIVQGGHAGDGNIDDDPLFVSSTDLHLQAGSPAIDHGTGCPSGFDMDGNPRWDIASVINGEGSSGTDIGAYEYQGNAGAGDTELTGIACP